MKLLKRTYKMSKSNIKPTNNDNNSKPHQTHCLALVSNVNVCVWGGGGGGGGEEALILILHAHNLHPGFCNNSCI